MRLAPLVIILAALAGQAGAATLHVAGNGVDGPTCGAPANPCRSITQAMTNATAGDTILVGPGRYGDLTQGETNFTFPGEEMPPAGSQYLLVVDKALTIQSTHGADATHLDAGFSFGGVQILADGVVLGGPSRGFSIEALAGGEAVRIDAAAAGVTVADIVAAGDFVFDGTSHTLTHNVSLCCESSSGFVIRGAQHTFSDNVVFAGGVIVEGTEHAITSNLFIGVGLSLSGTDHVVRRNSFLDGVLSIAGISLGSGSTATINENNIYGNWPQVYPPEGNCGIHNASGATIDATGNYWGAATGPGPDPADEVCDEPDTGSSTVVTPFATAPFQIASESPGGGGNGPPICTAARPYPNALWPANHQFVSAWIVGIADPDDDPVAVSITRVTQDEPLSGLGDGDAAPDAVLQGSSADLRAERAGSGNGRVYRIEFTASDGHGGSCAGAVTVGVPNSQKPGQEIVDDGQTVVSTGSE
jgi:hypothetical protein